MQHKDGFETPTDAEYIVELEQALNKIDAIIDIMHHAPRDPFGDEEEKVAYESYSVISKRLYALAHNRYVEQNKPNEK